MRRGTRRTVLVLSLALLAPAAHGGRSFAMTPQTESPSSTAPAKPAAGTPFTSEKLSQLLPATVYFQGQTAPLQLRNAAGTAFANGQIVWASLVDTSGYSTSVQERYQFYLVTEGPLQFGDKAVPAGVYGAGFLGERFLVMDVGGHTLIEGAVQTDADLRRPRPLQMQADTISSVKLYLGRRWVLLRASTP